MKKMTGPFSVKQLAQKYGRSEQTIIRWARDNPQQHNFQVKRATGPEGRKLLIWEIMDQSSERTDPFEKATAEKPTPTESVTSSNADLDALPLDLQFEILLHRKTLGKSTTQRTSMRKYYIDLYKKNGVIAKGLSHREGRKASGRKQTLSKEVEKRFIEMVENSAVDDVNAPGFITKNLRTVVNFHRRLEEELGKIPLDALYRLVAKHGLKKYLEKPDYTDDERDKILECFEAMPVFDMIQVDGCKLKYVEIRDNEGRWARPCAIELMDTGSRNMLAMDAYFSESNENSVDVFSQFLKSTEFPQKTIRFRPDRAGGFINLKRPIHELNREYSLPGKFYFSEDFARANKAKDKPHLESSHRRLHGFEDYITAKLPGERLVERVPGVKMKTESGKIEIVTISRFDISLEELRQSGLIKRYMKEHNERRRTFSVSGRQEKWEPKEKLETYLASVETFKFQAVDIENCLKYGLQKDTATVAPNGGIRFKKRDYRVVIGDFYGGRKRVNVKVSKYRDKLYIFEPAEDGICIGEAMLIGEPEKSERVKKAKEKNLKKNEFEQLVIYLERQGMTIKARQVERLTEIFKQGLTPDTATKIIKLHKKTYDSYLNNSRFNSLQVGIILFNLFLAHFAEYERNQGI